MPNLELAFAVHLEDYGLPDLDRHAGPLFHRWLPDREADTVALPSGDPNASLTAWFLRCGYTDDLGLVRFDYKRREVDASIMERQAVLDAGPIMGRLLLSDVTPQQLEAMREARAGDPEYVALGRRVVDLLYGPLKQLIEVLRVNYGQYWLRELTPWDSRRESLGSYCSSHFELQWRSAPADEWRDFQPTKNEATLTVKMTSEHEYKQYLLKEDFSALPQTLATGYTPGLPATALARAHWNYDQGATTYAFIEAATALELAIHDRIRRTYETSEALTKAVDAFWNLPTRAQLVSLAAIEGTLPAADIELAVAAIDIRNDIIHDGFQPPRTAKTHDAITALMRVTARFLPGPAFKFPRSPHGNRLYSAGE